MNIYDSIIDIEECHENCGELVMFEGTTKVNLGPIQTGTKCCISFIPEQGTYQIYNIDTGNRLHEGKYAISILS